MQLAVRDIKEQNNANAVDFIRNLNIVFNKYSSMFSTAFSLACFESSLLL